MLNVRHMRAHNAVCGIGYRAPIALGTPHLWSGYRPPTPELAVIQVDQHLELFFSARMLCKQIGGIRLSIYFPEVDPM